MEESEKCSECGCENIESVYECSKCGKTLHEAEANELPECDICSLPLCPDCEKDNVCPDCDSVLCLACFPEDKKKCEDCRDQSK